MGDRLANRKMLTSFDEVAGAGTGYPRCGWTPAVA
jgi:hypothetical protein